MDVFRKTEEEWNACACEIAEINVGAWHVVAEFPALCPSTHLRETLGHVHVFEKTKVLRTNPKQHV